MKKRIAGILVSLFVLLSLFPSAVLAEPISTTPAAEPIRLNEEAQPDSSTKTVYVTISDDGEAVTGKDGTKIARLPFEISYFDLADYDLENFYRYESAPPEEGGGYIGDKPLEQPTLLHLYIKVIEQYYLGGEKLVVGQSKQSPDDDYYALNITGSATSMYMSNFWGHDENLMYFVNHAYPLMSAGWGATADYILLEDGMEIDVGMFSNWSFWGDGAFLYFDVTSATLEAGQSQSFSTLKAATGSVWDGSESKPTPAGGMTTLICDEKGKQIADITSTVSEDGTFSYTFEEPGTYMVCAKDPEAGTDEAKIAPAYATIVVKEKPEPVTRNVFITISDDGEAVKGKDGTPIARLPFEISYFDLADYDLENFYRYESAPPEEGGGYIGDKPLEEPTLLHLYIKVIEQYYLGGEKLVVGQSKQSPDDDYYALNITGSATSMYMSNFWGHDENLMYFVNHAYPLMSAGWGATADYILLEDGMEIDVGMFSNWSFWGDGAFLYFDVTSATLEAGQSQSFSTLKAATGSVWDGSESKPTPAGGMTTLICDESGKTIADITSTVSEEGTFSYTFEEPGTYMVCAKDPEAGTDEAKIAPAYARIVVTNRRGDIDGDGIVDNKDAAMIYAYFNGMIELTDEQLKCADVNRDGIVDNTDAALIYSYFNGVIEEFPVE